jgi:hypothetical protein
MLPTLEINEGSGKKPRVLVLEIRDRNKTDRGVIARLLVERERDMSATRTGSWIRRTLSLIPHDRRTRRAGERAG